jgi:hypothetical protein
MNTKDSWISTKESLLEIMATCTKLIFHWQKMPGGSFSIILTHPGCRGSMGVNPSSLSIPLNPKEEASWLQADVIPLESLGELWSECNGDERSSSKLV